MIIPKSINILGVRYSILERDRIEDDSGECLGQCDSSNQTITIRRPSKPDLKGIILLHEILEAINNHLDLKLKHDIINRLDVALHQVLKENNLVFSGKQKRTLRETKENL